MTVTADKFIRPALAIGGHLMRKGAEAASQTFKRGAPLVDSSGYLAEATSGAAVDIVGFAAVRVQDINGHTLEGAFQNAIIGERQLVASSGFGTGACSSLELYGVSLWR